jgi:hypothetical protein
MRKEIRHMNRQLGIGLDYYSKFAVLLYLASSTIA